MSVKEGTSRQVSPDLEVANVMGNKSGRTRCLAQPRSRSAVVLRPSTTSPYAGSSSVQHRSCDPSPSPLGLVQDGFRKSAFSPYKPTTVLTNLQRGNVETQTPVIISDFSIHQLAAQGELLVDDDNKNGDLDLHDENGLTPLMWACAYGQVPTINLLLKKGVDVNARGNNGENALLLASSNGHTDAIKILVEKMNVNFADEEGNTALMYAAFNNHASCAQELLYHNADITLENEYGDTAFTIAVARGSKHVQMILERYILGLLENS